MQVVTKRIKMQGMIVGDYHSDAELMHAFRKDMAQYVQEGKVKVHEHLTEGIENAGCAFIEVGAPIDNHSQTGHVGGNSSQQACRPADSNAQQP